MVILYVLLGLIDRLYCMIWEENHLFRKFIWIINVHVWLLILFSRLILLLAVKILIVIRLIWGKWILLKLCIKIISELLLIWIILQLVVNLLLVPLIKLFGFLDLIKVEVGMYIMVNVCRLLIVWFILLMLIIFSQVFFRLCRILRYEY